MLHSLSDILSPVKDEANEFNRRFKRSMISTVPLVNLIAKYLIRTKGKQIRPMLVLLSAKACGGVVDATYRAATLVELLHTATLVHDDVIDEADTRRGFASIRSLWRNKAGVLMGDYLLAKGLLLTVETSEYHFLEITSTAVRRMSEGELYQLQKSRQLNIDEASYFKLIADKTASLIATCCEIGAASVLEKGENAAQREKLRAYGEAAGIAFQIRDDLFDYEDGAKIIGKPVGNDLKDKKLTLPLIHTLSTLETKEEQRIRKLIKSGKASEGERKLIMNLVAATGGLSYARTKAEEYSEAARKAIESLPESTAKKALIDFSYYVIEREK
ncbi:MAG: polyprenyl synthetase family protein [Bacteroidota bacterium]|nr:polyprenyl synthetase family protein [Bacteroidota bacterium]MDP4230660.1 polyprenyl synthetase family protein [Bacteroidota bacterium]MDP4235015.1 polyprenyl synthetase family protein [Bacteroidota bacterium]